MATRPTLSELGDDWYESEPALSIGFVAELQRIRRRTAARPWPTLLLAAVITTAVVYKLATKEKLRYAQVILGLSEGELATKRNGLPVDNLHEYVTSILLSDHNLLALIERENLYPLRRSLGPQFAISELWDQLEVEVWNNSFLYYTHDERLARKSARIGITFKDRDPDRAFALASEIARLTIRQHEDERARLTGMLAADAAHARERFEQEASELALTIAFKQTALAQARKASAHGLSAALLVELAALERRTTIVDRELTQIALSRDAMADKIEAAGLDIVLGVVEERRPARLEEAQVALVLAAFVIGACVLGVSAVLLGAFDSRIHDPDDVARLGLPVLGHVPRFPGDHVGSLKARGVQRSRGSRVMRWRSHR